MSVKSPLRVMRQEEVVGVATVTWLRTPKDQDAVLVVPSWGPGPWPLLVALHGLGEARKGSERGAYGWVRDYNLVQAMGRLHAPPLRSDDLQSIYDTKRITGLNQRLTEHPFEGLAVLCPYTPDLLQERSLDNAEPFADHLVATWLPGVRAHEPRLLPEREHTGLDGVSLGGRVALLAGLRHPEAFGALGSLQAALQMNEARPLARRVAAARKTAPLPLRLLTSEGDFYRDEIGALHRELEKSHEAHEHIVVPGPHDYPFNRGPGAVEMLMWHDRKLRGG